MDSFTDIKTIACQELKEKLDRGDTFKLVMTYHKHAFDAKHIPGSINIESMGNAEGLIDKSDEIIVYCTNENCSASVFAYRELKKQGFTNIRRFAGGLLAWDEAGYPLEGTYVEKTIEPDKDFRF
jgi:rhodanese-related sulfurtransferase